MDKKYCYEYPRPAVTSDCVVFGWNGTKLNVLLIVRGNNPYKGSWAIPGGFLNMDENSEECAIRELFEETRIKVSNIKQIGAFSAVNRDPRGRTISIVFYTLLNTSEYFPQADDDATLVQWHDIYTLPPLAFDHAEILNAAINRLIVEINAWDDMPYNDLNHIKEYLNIN